jgi:hypothetical protein
LPDRLGVILDQIAKLKIHGLHFAVVSSVRVIDHSQKRERIRHLQSLFRSRASRMEPGRLDREVLRNIEVLDVPTY